MFRSFTAWLALIVGALLATPAAATGEFSSGNWKGAAFFEKGRFTNCLMFAPYVTGWRMVFSMDGQGYVDLGFEHADLSLTPGNSADFRLQIDRSPVISRNFKALSRTMFATTFTGSVDWFQRLRKGRNLKIWIGNSTESFSLQGTNSALAKLFACVARYR
jgi:hypothetical protein